MSAPRLRLSTKPTFDALKNGDAAVGGALARAARRADQSLHAAILHVEEHGIAAETGDYPGWDDLGKPWEMEEVFQTEVWFEDWIAPNGTRRDYGRVPLLAGELLPSGALDDAEPDDEEVNVTGNEGVELSHSYRRAALVLWPEQDTVRTLARGGIGGAVAYVADELVGIDVDADVSARALALVTLVEAADHAPYAGHGGELRRLRASIEHGATPGVARNPFGDRRTSIREELDRAASRR